MASNIESALLWITLFSLWATHTAFRLKHVQKPAFENASMLEVEEQTTAAVMYLDGTGQSRMVVTRPATGWNGYSGVGKSFRLGSWHREMLWQTGSSCIQPVFTKKGSGRMCSVGLFSSQHSCSSVSQSTVAEEHERWKTLIPTSNRGVGIELELVARAEAGSIRGAKSCFYQKDRGITQRGREHWNWISDPSVKPLTYSEVNELGASSDNARGVGLEVTSPGPPNVLAGETGFKALIDMLTILRHMGVQTGPTQGMHVHINVKGNAGGSKLSRRQIAYVFAAYARYQFSIHEMLSPSRIPNYYARSLFLGNVEAIRNGRCSSNPAGCVRRMFEQLHSWVKAGSSWDSRSDRDFCNHIMAMPENTRPCDRGKPSQRYFEVNMHPIQKFGTIEFRGHSATTDTSRVLRWVQFLVGFVERFGKAGGTATGMKEFFTSSASADYAKLQRAQQTAKFSELWTQIERGRPGQARKWKSKSQKYYRDRSWEADDQHCRPTTAARSIRPACNTYASTLQMEAQEWATPSVVSEQNGTRIMRAPVPASFQPGSYLEVEMPEGIVRAEPVNEASISNGFIEFSYVPGEGLHGAM